MNSSPNWIPSTSEKQSDPEWGLCNKPRGRIATVSEPSRADLERARIRAILEAEPWAGGRGESSKAKAEREAKSRNRKWRRSA